VLEKISWTNHVRNEEGLHTAKKKKEYPTYNKKVGEGRVTGLATCCVGTDIKNMLLSQR
jgi:hypothetical protein